MTGTIRRKGPTLMSAPTETVVWEYAIRWDRPDGTHGKVERCPCGCDGTTDKAEASARWMARTRLGATLVRRRLPEWEEAT